MVGLLAVLLTAYLLGQQATAPVYTKGNVLIRAFVDADVLIRHPEGFCFCDGITL